MHSNGLLDVNIKGFSMSAHARKEIAERQRQYQIKTLLSGNNHTLIQMSSAEFLDYLISVKMTEGLSRNQAIDWIDAKLDAHNALSAKWQRYKDTLKTTVGLYPLFDDVYALGLLAAALHRQGNVFGKYRIKVYNGSPNVIINTYPSLRAHLTGTKYLASNPKLISIGVGKLSANSAMKGGFVVSLIISVAFNALDQLLNDNATWHKFVANVAVDMAIVGSSIVAVEAILWAGGSLLTGVTLAPLAVVVVVGTLVTLATTLFIDTSSITEALSLQLQKTERDFKNNIISINREFKKLEVDHKSDPKGLMHRLFGIPNLQLNNRNFQ